MTYNNAEIRRRLMADLGQPPPVRRPHRRVNPLPHVIPRVPPTTALDGRKTTAMRLVEARTGFAIEVVLSWGNSRQIADRLARDHRLTIEQSTIFKWKDRLGIDG